MLSLAASGGGGSVTGVSSDWKDSVDAANAGSANDGGQMSDHEIVPDNFARYRASDRQSYT